MLCTVTFVLVKPVDKPRFVDVYPEVLQRIRDWQYSFPGLLDISVETIDETTTKSILIFESRSAYDAYEAACPENPDWVQRDEYNKSIGATTTVTIS